MYEWVLKSLTSLFRERVSFAFTSICKKTRLRRHVREGSSSLGKKVSPRIEDTTRATVYSYVGLPSGISVTPRENLRAPS